MKRFVFGAVLLTVLGLVGMAIGLSLLPDTIPMHYNFAGEADRMGSKYEVLVVAVIGVVMAAVLLAMAAHIQRFTKSEQEAKVGRSVLAWLAIAMLVLFFGLAMWSLYLGYRYVQQGSSAVSPVDAQVILKGSAAFIGLLLVVLGNFMPKARQNAIFGLRVPWTMDNETVWMRSQRFAGITAVICGFLILLTAIFLPGVGAMIAMTVLLTAWVIAALAVSWKYHKEALAG